MRSSGWGGTYCLIKLAPAEKAPYKDQRNPLRKEMNNQMMKVVTMMMLAAAVLCLGACAKDRSSSSTTYLGTTYSK